MPLEPQEALSEQNSYMYIYDYEYLTFYTVIKCQNVVSLNDVKARNSSATLLNDSLNFLVINKAQASDSNADEFLLLGAPLDEQTRCYR